MSKFYTAHTVKLDTDEIATQLCAASTDELVDLLQQLNTKRTIRDRLQHIQLRQNTNSQSVDVLKRFAGNLYRGR